MLARAVRAKQEARQAGSTATGGFRPARAEGGRRITFVLGRCSFAKVAATDPGTICDCTSAWPEGWAAWP